MKLCKTCGETKSLEEFHRRGEKHQPRCKACSKTKHAEYYKNLSAERKTALRVKNKQSRVERQEQINLLKTKPCMDCGRVCDPVGMDFDHVRGEKLFNVAKAADMLYPWETVLEEIAKCDLVCAVCHRIRTRDRLLMAV